VSRCIGGDSNVVHYSCERLSDSKQSPAMLNLLEFGFDQDLMDILLVGGNFTWSNNRDSQSWSRIYRFLPSPEWEEQFPDVSQRRLPRILADHFPLMLDCVVSSKDSMYFKFEKYVVEVRGLCGAGENMMDVLQFSRIS
jgi:hypothetical protein